MTVIAGTRDRPQLSRPREGEGFARPLTIGEISVLVARVVENGDPCPSPRLFAGRGWVRGRGNWPRGGDWVQDVKSKRICGRRGAWLQRRGYSPRPLTQPLPARGGERRMSPHFE